MGLVEDLAEHASPKSVIVGFFSLVLGYGVWWLLLRPIYQSVLLKKLGARAPSIPNQGLFGKYSSILLTRLVMPSTY